jgi:hypothetical protein
MVTFLILLNLRLINLTGLHKDGNWQKSLR